MYFQAAAALLFNQLILHGLDIEVHPDDLMNAALAEFTDLAQVNIGNVLQPYFYYTLNPLYSRLCLTRSHFISNLVESI